MFLLHYGNMGCQVFKQEIQNWKYFCLKINIHPKNWWILRIMPCPSMGPKWLWTVGRVPIVLHGSNLFWSGPNHFGHIQIRLFWTKFYNLDGPKSFWTHRRTRHTSSSSHLCVFSAVNVCATMRVILSSSSYFFSLVSADYLSHFLVNFDSFDIL